MRTHGELDLTLSDKVDAFFASERPEVVVLAAAHVGGIKANSTYPADFILQNIAIQSSVINAALKFFGFRETFSHVQMEPSGDEFCP